MGVGQCWKVMDIIVLLRDSFYSTVGEASGVAGERVASSHRTRTTRDADSGGKGSLEIRQTLEPASLNF
jgi:hypothetical protein